MDQSTSPSPRFPSYGVKSKEAKGEEESLQAELPLNFITSCGQMTTGFKKQQDAFLKLLLALSLISLFFKPKHHLVELP